MRVPKLVREVSDASGFGLIVRVTSPFIEPAKER
jgi:hypothetical protein